MVGNDRPETTQEVEERPGPETYDDALDAPLEGPSDGTAPDAEAEGTAAAEAAGPPVLAEFEGLAKSYGTQRALGPLTLRIEGGCIGLLGPNGAGKSTLIRLMMGLLQPTGGTVKVLGEHVRPGAKRLRAKIGYVPEGDARFPGLSGVQAVQYAGRLVGMERSEAVQRAHQVLDYVGLGEARYRDVSTYSTGMKQRLKIAQALVHDPQLLILDEPTEGVDPEAREDILTLIGELVRDHGLQLLLSTHLLHDVERIATHAIILHEGNVVEYGRLDELRTARGRGYQLRVNGNADLLIARLKDQGLDAEWTGNALRVHTDDPVALLGHVAAAGLVVRHIAPVELSLNEVFEEAVRRPAPAAPAAGTNGELEETPHA